MKTIFYNSKCRRDKFLFTFNGKKSMRSVAIEHVYNGSNCILMALGSLMFRKLFDEFFKICACQDKLEDKVNPRCL